MGDLLHIKVPGAPVNQYQAREAYGTEDLGYKGYVAQSQVPQNASVQGQSAAGAAPNQAQRTFVSEVTNPANTDIVLYTVPSISTTLNGATAAGIQTVTLASAANIIPGMLLQITDATNGNDAVWVTAVNQSTNQVTGFFNFKHATGSTVTCARTFFVTDYTVTTSSTTQHKAILKSRSTISSGTIATGSHAVTFNNPSLTPQNGDCTFVGGTVYMEDPSSGTYEPVVVTALSRNAAGVITGFTATFADAHAANSVVAFPVAVAYVNSTKGIEAFGVETQSTVPPGQSLAIYFGAVTGTVEYNVAGFEQ